MWADVTRKYPQLLRLSRITASRYYICPKEPPGSPRSSVVKESACNAGDPGLIPGLRRSPGEGNGSPLQYSYLGNPWTEDPDRLQSLGVTRARHDWVTKHTQRTIWVWSSLQNQLPVCRGAEERRCWTGPWVCTRQRRLGDAANSQALRMNTCKETKRMDEEPID